MPVWFEPLSRFGIPTLAVGVLAWFFATRVWTYMVESSIYYRKQIEEMTKSYINETSRKEERIAALTAEIANLRERLTEHMDRFKG
jgi:hypothetical protein